jgi:hypothetical protein
MNGKALIEINREALNDRACYDILIEAANTILASSEKDYETIKNEEWYTRLWELLTFSHDNEKLLARGVNSLAQMQDIIIKIILMLSSENYQIANLVIKNRDAINDTIERLNKQQDEIITIKKALSLAVYYPRITISEIPPHDRGIILCAIFKYASPFPENELAQPYIKIVKECLNLRGETPDGSKFDYADLDKLEGKKSNELLFSIICDLTLLFGKPYKFNKRYNKAVEYISISKPKKKLIWEKNKKIVRIEGKELLVQKYDNYSLPSFYVDSEILDLVTPFEGSWILDNGKWNNILVFSGTVFTLYYFNNTDDTKGFYSGSFEYTSNTITFKVDPSTWKWDVKYLLWTEKYTLRSATLFIENTKGIYYTGGIWERANITASEAEKIFNNSNIIETEYKVISSVAKPLSIDKRYIAKSILQTYVGGVLKDFLGGDKSKKKNTLLIGDLTGKKPPLSL